MALQIPSWLDPMTGATHTNVWTLLTETKLIGGEHAADPHSTIKLLLEMWSSEAAHDKQPIERPIQLQPEIIERVDDTAKFDLLDADPSIDACEKYLIANVAIFASATQV